MNAKVITRENIGVWLKSLSDKYEVLAPVTENDTTRFLPIDDPAKIDLTCQSKSMREVFTPGTETLFEYKLSGQAAEVTASDPAPRDRFVFGARACDAAALKYVDAVYSMVKPVDTPYFDRRDHTVIAGVFCSDPWWSCFCTEVNDFLMSPVMMDLHFTDIGEKYYVQAFTPKGEEILGAPQFVDAADADAQAAGAVRQKALSTLPERKNHEAECLTYDWSSPMWTKLAQKCMGCGICAYSCPTCHCFDIMECHKGKSGSRYRCWDTCQFEKFTLMGHGHNPRPSKTERTRQRVFHKFKYSVERYGMLGCVGCGRCISLCPVNIDIQQVVNELESSVPAGVDS